VLEAGRYRARALELRGGQYVMAESKMADTDDHLTIRASDDGWPSEEGHVTLQPTLELMNDTEREQLVLLERMAWSDQAVTAAEVTTLQTFRDLFSAEALRPGEQIAVGSLTVVFTDLRGSTQMYQQIGDAPAFGRVMDHFDVLRSAIDAEGGAIVKTIGDAVMAVFRRPISALRAMVAAQDALASSASLLVLKIGMHYGPCIAVTLNDRLDYFGTTINIAARIQNLSQGGDILISDDVMQDSEVLAWLTDRQGQHTYNTFDASLKGIQSTVRLWRLTRIGEPLATGE
jgi:class 3 adenylate cyclase